MQLLQSHFTPCTIYIFEKSIVNNQTICFFLSEELFSALFKEKTTLSSEISEKFIKKTPFFEILGPRSTLTFKPFLRENGDKHEV